MAAQDPALETGGTAGDMAGGGRAAAALLRLKREFEAERERWLLWLPVVFGAGIGVYFSLLVEPPLWLGVAGLGALAAAGLLAWRRPGLWLTLIALGALAAGFAAAQARTHFVAAPVLEKTHGPARVTGQVLSVEPRAAGGRVLLHRLEVAGLDPAGTPARARVRLTMREPGGFVPGDRIRVRAVLRPPPEPAAPGAFDFARRAYFERLGAVGYAVGHAERLDRGGQAQGTAEAWRLWWAGLRDAVARQVLAALPDARGALAAALMTGERGAIPEPVIQAMRDSGLAHLLAISGLHMGLVAGLLFFALRALMALAPALALRQPIKKWAAIAAACGAFAYLCLVGAPVPTQRAFLMVSLVLLAVVLDRSALSLRLVAWAAFAVLLIAPESLLSASFQMSFAAVTGLVAGYEALGARGRAAVAERGAAGRLALYLGGVALTSVIAIAATAPFAVYHFNRMAWYGLAANLVAVPLTGFWIMPWALLAFVLLPFGLEALALVPMGWGLGAVIAVAETIASLPGAVLPVRAMPTAGLLLMVAGGLWLCLWRRPWRLAGLALVLAGLAGAALVRPPDLLASGDGKLLAVRGADGEVWLSSSRRARFTAETWLRRAGRAEASAWPRDAAAAGGALRCDALGCIYRAKDQVVALALDGRALAEDCRSATVLISLEPLRRRACPGPRVLIDRFDLWREGSHALWLSPAGVRVESVAGSRGRRPWVRWRPEWGD
ncbi:MAG: ComEC family competence protein [Rhodospirillales bacterium]|nr:ComEC family competence protein [Rhodospirillales bacterium]